MKKSASAVSAADSEISQLGSHIYDELIKSIREGRYTPGEHIRETVVATELGVSRTPVREALRRLHNDGTVVLTPRKGAVVAELAHQEVVELYMLRQEMEATAARFAAQHASDIEIMQIDNILKRAEELLHDPHRLNQVNWEFHNAIYEATHNRYFMKAIRSISDSMMMLRGARYIPENRPEQLASEHRAIFNAIQNRKPQEAADAARYHIQQSLLVHLNSNNRSFSEHSRKS
ncbi:GntR family transcriptional regulator [Paenochrobactrum glaciei]|uniref:GntR family transcriptional regulator n=1 Tax=Paenochrobactrum glaciei TaxID=486407 RepID=A0ABN1GPX1_9HYPH